MKQIFLSMAILMILATMMAFCGCTDETEGSTPISSETNDSQESVSSSFVDGSSTNSSIADNDDEKDEDGVYRFSGVVYRTDSSIDYYYVDGIEEDKLSFEVKILEKIGAYQVTKINSDVFCDVDNIRSVYIPKTVTEIEGNAFIGCKDLMNINVDEENPAYKSESGVLYTKDGKKLLAYPSGKISQSFVIATETLEIAPYAFKNAVGLKSAELSSALRVIGYEAFSGCTALNSIVFPDSLMEIGSFAFFGCSLLGSVIIPARTTIIGEAPFAACSSLTQIGVNAANPRYTSVDGNLCSREDGVLLQYAVGKKDTYYQIPEDIQVVELGAFYGAANLESVSFESLTRIGTSAFRDCVNLKSMYLSCEIRTVGAYAFAGCTNLTIYFEESEESVEFACLQTGRWAATWNSDNRPVVYDYAE